MDRPLKLDYLGATSISLRVSGDFDYVVVANADFSQTVTSSAEEIAALGGWTPSVASGRIEVFFLAEADARPAVEQALVTFPSTDEPAYRRLETELAYHLLGKGSGEPTGEKIIYGEDDREEVSRVSDSRLRQLASATCALVLSSDFSTNNDGSVNLFTRSFNSVLGSSLCSDERFRGQPTVANCTGFLVAPNLVLTAGHCVDSTSDCTSQRFIFGYQMKDNGDEPDTRVPASRVYRCTQLVRRVLNTSTEEDWALVRLDRSVTVAEPLAIRRSGSVSTGTSVYVAGHPSGLPMKIAGGATVKVNSSGQTYFESNLDTYGGNSGSAVVSLNPLQVEGILVRGGTDYTFRFFSQCYASNEVSDSGSNGSPRFEQCQKPNSTMLSLIPTATLGRVSFPGATTVAGTNVRITVDDSDPAASSVPITVRSSRGGSVQVAATRTSSSRFEAVVPMDEPIFSAGDVVTAEYLDQDNGSGAEQLVSATTQLRLAEEPGDVLSQTWYFAEGAAFPDLQTFILIANPNSIPITVEMELLLESGSNLKRDIDVPAGSRKTVELNSIVQRTGVSTVLRSKSGIGFAAERSMYVLSPTGWNAAHATVGLQAAATSWFLAEGATANAGPDGERFQTFILLANPNSSAVNATVTYYPEGRAPIVRQQSIGAGRRVTLEPGTQVPGLENTAFSTQVTVPSNAPIFVERAMWWRDAQWPYSSFLEGNVSPGITAASTRWFFAEGDTNGIDEFILFVNQNASAANVTLTYLFPDAPPVTRALQLAPQGRRTINATFDAEGPGRVGQHATLVESSVPIAVERSMYWNRGDLNAAGGHNAIPASALADDWLLPEGATFGSFQTEILVANPSAVGVGVTFTFLREGESPVEYTVSVLGQRRFTLDVDTIPGMDERAFSTRITATQPIVVERSMYLDYEQPIAVERILGTCSLGIPIPRAGVAVIDTKAPASGGTLKPEREAPTPTATPMPTPLR
jgi:hypothetical protein